MRRIYLDHAATTPVRSEVLKAMLPYYSETFGNASSVHSFGQEAKKALEKARKSVANCIGADPEEIYLTSGGTESDNLAIQGVVRAMRKKGNHIITSAIEHHAVLNCCKAQEKEGIDVTYLPVNGHGVVDLDALAAAVRPETLLISIMLANNETGTLQPIVEAAHIAREKGVPLHTDAVQAVGKIPVKVADLGVDLLSISAHKIYGPKGIGALYVRAGTRFDAILHGGHHEQHKRPGTENVASVVGLAKAVELAMDEIDTAIPRITQLRNRLQRGIEERMDHTHLNGHPEKRLPNILNVSFEFVEGESILLTLDMQGIAVSTGSACSSETLGPSHVLSAMGVERGVAHGSIRFSLGQSNTVEQIDRVIEALVGVVERLRRTSPLQAERGETK